MKKRPVSKRNPETGRFVSSPRKRKSAPKKKPRARINRKKKRRLGSSRLMQAIVDSYESSGIEIADYPESIEDRVLRESEIWHWYHVEFTESFTLEEIPYLTEFFGRILRRRYFRGAIIRVSVAVENSSGLSPGLWRTLVATESARSSFSQVENHAEAWLRGSDYTVVRGIGIDVRAPKYYEWGFK